MKIRRVGAEFFHADGQTDMKTLTVAFRNFMNAPKKADNHICEVLQLWALRRSNSENYPVTICHEVN